MSLYEATDAELIRFQPIPSLVDLEELKTWIIHEDEDLLVVNKPGWLVCHPSKNGPLSSLVGACKEYTGLDRLHLVSRLDRETSGIIILAKHRQMASTLQTALENRRVHKTYLTILEGTLEHKTLVDQPLARDMDSPVFVKQIVREDRTAQAAQTLFRPVISSHGFTLTQVEPISGRKHQIRAHAEWLSHRVVADKIYGPDDTLYLEFIEKGFTDHLGSILPLKRQALHASRLVFQEENFCHTFSASLPEDMKHFCTHTMGLSETILSTLPLPWL